MKRNDSKTQPGQENVEGERRHTRETTRPSLDPLHTADANSLGVGETAFHPQADRHAALLSQTCSDAQRSNIVLHLQRTYGNSYVQRLLNSMAVQANLTVNAPNDIYEQEADGVAGTVTRDISSQAQRQEEEEELQMKPASQVQRQEEEELIQEKDAELQRQVVSQDLEARINSARGGGQPLAQSVRASFEPQFGRDFSEVRIHADANADSLSRELGTEAFTTGKDIFFREGTYNPDTGSGRGLIAHELTHVVQQQAVPVVQRNDVEPTEAPKSTNETAPGTAASGKGPLLTPGQAKVWNNLVTMRLNKVLSQAKADRPDWNLIRDSLTKVLVSMESFRHTKGLSGQAVEFVYNCVNEWYAVADSNATGGKSFVHNLGKGVKWVKAIGRE